MKKIFTTLFFVACLVAVQAQSPRNVTLIDFTGTWCGWCTGATVIIEDLEAQYGEPFIPIAVHSGDPMELPEGGELTSFFGVNSYPSGTVDRKIFSGTTSIPNARGNWTAQVAEQINISSPMEIEILYGAIDKVSKEVYVRANIHRTGNVNLDFVRTNVWLLEDDVLSSDPQANFYSSTSAGPDPNHPMYSQPSQIADFVHNDVFRAAPLGAFGQSGLLSTSEDVTPFEWRFPAPDSLDGGIDTDEMKVVVFTSFYTDGGLDGNEVINASEYHLNSYIKSNPLDPNHPENPQNWPTSVNDAIESNIELSVGPNPISDLGIATFNLPTTEHVTVELFNLYGQRVETLMSRNLVANTDQRVAIDGNALADGIYILSLTAGDQVVTERIVIAH